MNEKLAQIPCRIVHKGSVNIRLFASTLLCSSPEGKCLQLNIVGSASPTIQLDAEGVQELNKVLEDFLNTALSEDEYSISKILAERAATKISRGILT